MQTAQNGLFSSCGVVW